MEGLTKNTRLSRQGSRVRRHRSQEWQDYSSSDNEDHHHHVDSRAYRYPATADEPYEEQRTPDNRKHGLVECDPTVHGNYCSSGRVLSPL
ncbi:hypothetical protein AVEN_197664-1 [Araneus ventricosus]|uniref:Uncharacterized protein n=1 Tax=Araneus ventricosus TaxID=182803 RepID=A0A4Y2GUI5_ARAVE|nr:hypothetical protein AVEN_197664-1 [Araneus ventricosus]